MDKHCSTAFALIAAFCALVHFGIVYSVLEECPWNFDLSRARKGCRGCPRDHICCLFDGEDVCVPSVLQKPGLCPHRHWDFEQCDEFCTWDSDCPKNEKCCSTKCGHVCLAPVLADECPRNLDLALSHKGCEDCPRDHICCVFRGVEVCVPPVSKKPVCPHRCLDFGNCVESCSNDKDCKQHEKCCSNGCGHECMPVIMEYCHWCHDHALSHVGCRDFPRHHDDEKPGVCPHRDLDFVKCIKLCSSDSDCPKNEKCCSTGCGQKCMPPVLVKPGMCPRSQQTPKRCGEFCSNDGNCPDNDKCCSNGCGHECMTPEIVWPLFVA